jgi:outer membrane receptor protein involved in Fe transport
VAGPDRTVSRIIGDEILLFSPFPPPGGFIDIGNPRALAPNNGLIPASQDDDFLSPKATVQWRPTDEAQIYFSWALANKPAGIALLTGGAAGFDPEGQRFEREEMQVWELGAKSEWFDRRLTVNGAVFFQDYKDKQVSVQAVADNGQLVPRTENASSAEVWGLELDAQWVPTDWLSVFGSYTFLDTEYTDFFEETPGAGNIAQAGVKRPDNCEVIFKDGSNRALCRLNLSGNELEYAPRNAFVGGFTLSAPIGQDMRGFFESNLVYQDDRYVDRFNAAKLDSYTVVDFRLGLRSDTWDIVAYVDNAFEDETIKTGVPNVLTRGLQAVAFPSPFTLVFPAGFQGVLPDLRQFGIRASFRFGGQQ